MGRNKYAEFDLQRPRPSSDKTVIFHRQLNMLDRFGYGLSGQAICELMNISKNALRRWEKERLLFPTIIKQANGYRKKKYRYKEVLRCVTIKFLITEYKLKRFKAVRLFLEMANLAIYSAKESPKSINNVRIDQFLMKVLDYDVEEIASREYFRSSKRKESEIIDMELDNDCLE